ncbi:HAD family hydrolase [Amycolatopsis nigrescens]|uniref:HAD family hydrolase n=1 Tax=Amycolatopsis nigrescens TaxID=381445 RepID=UPI00037C2D64|nr:HAD-IA family hydrolase [Amycolatopsis nigrescens]
MYLRRVPAGPASLGVVLKALVLDYAGVLTDPDAAELFDAVLELRDRGVPTALLSNAAGGSGEVKRRFSRYFDAVVFSGEVGVAKPDPRIYLLTAGLLGVPADSCVFVDDSAVNVAGAVAAGMTGVRHSSVTGTLSELRVLLPA